jgi:hypothetical protein
MPATDHRELAPPTFAAAGGLLAVKAVLGFWAAYALLTASKAHHRSFLGGTVSTKHTGLGLLLLLLAVASVVVAAGLLRAAPWGRTAAFALEGAGAVLAGSRLVAHPLSSTVSLALAAAIIGLLLARRSAPITT